MDKTAGPGRVKGTLTPPCSKSYAQRALAAALLSEEVSVLRNLEFCDDTRSALRCIEALGARVRQADPTPLSIAGGLAPKVIVLSVFSPLWHRSAPRPSSSRGAIRYCAARWG